MHLNYSLNHDLTFWPSSFKYSMIFTHDWSSSLHQVRKKTFLKLIFDSKVILTDRHPILTKISSKQKINSFSFVPVTSLIRSNEKNAESYSPIIFFIIGIRIEFLMMIISSCKIFFSTFTNQFFLHSNTKTHH